MPRNILAYFDIPTAEIISCNACFWFILGIRHQFLLFTEIRIFIYFLFFPTQYILLCCVQMNLSICVITRSVCLLISLCRLLHSSCPSCIMCHISYSKCSLWAFLKHSSVLYSSGKAEVSVPNYWIRIVWNTKQSKRRHTLLIINRNLTCKKKLSLN